MLPPNAPDRFCDRETLWNEVEKIEQHPKAQLAFSFDIALQNEFSMEENRQVVRQFLQEEFVSRGMIVDYAIHEKDAGEDGIQNPHFHVLCPIRPLNPDGNWGNKQRREYILDEHGNRIPDGKLTAEYKAESEALKPIREELKELYRIKSKLDPLIRLAKKQEAEHTHPHPASPDTEKPDMEPQKG